MELHVPDFVGVARRNIIQTIWCWQCVQFSQVIFVLIPESIKTLILQNFYAYMSFLSFLQPMLQFYTPWKHQWFLKGVRKMEHWLEIGEYLRVKEGLWFLLFSKSQWNRNRYVSENLNSYFWIFMLCKCICISELTLSWMG